jgi:hypothetical protein
LLFAQTSLPCCNCPSFTLKTPCRLPSLTTAPLMTQEMESQTIYDTRAPPLHHRPHRCFNPPWRAAVVPSRRRTILSILRPITRRRARVSEQYCKKLSNGWMIGLHHPTMKGTILLTPTPTTPHQSSSKLSSSTNVVSLLHSILRFYNVETSKLTSSNYLFLQF